MYMYKYNAKIDNNCGKTVAAAAAYTAAATAAYTAAVAAAAAAAYTPASAAATYLEILCITIKYIEMHNNDLIASTYSIAVAAAAAAATPLQLHIK